ncbi:MAG TPA: hypothetical protein VIL89_00675 [Clostridia bacterium]
MNAYFCRMQQQYSYMTQCPYAHMCPVRNQCPVCPHREEQFAPAGPEYYYNTGANDDNREQIYQETNPYQSGSFEEYGLYNLYPQENIYTGRSKKSPYCDSVNYMYIDPRENITSPWDNDRRFDNNLVNAIPLPERPFG